VGFGLNMASAAILGGVTWHTSNFSVIDRTMSGGPNNLLFGRARSEIVIIVKAEEERKFQKVGSSFLHCNSCNFYF